MAEPGIVLTKPAFAELAKLVNKGRRLPTIDKVTRRVGAGRTGPTTIINTVNDAGCGCCNCLKCVNLCDLATADVVTECAECPNGATKTYTATVADGAGWIETGDITLTHVDGGCVWETAEFDITIDGVTGTYKWVLTQAGAASTLVLKFVDGYSDVVGVEITYTATTTSGQAWSCVCRSKMELTTDRETIPFDSGLVCEVCIIAHEPTRTGGCVRCANGVNVSWRMDSIDVVTTGDPDQSYSGVPPDLIDTKLLRPHMTTVPSCNWAVFFDNGANLQLYVNFTIWPDGWQASVYRVYGDLDTGSSDLIAEYLLLDDGSDCDGPKTLEKTFGPAFIDEVPDTLTFTPSDTYTNPNGCGTPGGAGPCGTCQVIWCENGTVTIPSGDVTCTTGTWLEYDPCTETTGDCACGAPDRDGAYNGEIVVMPCYGNP